MGSRVIYLIYRSPSAETCSAGGGVQSHCGPCPPASQCWPVSGLAFKALQDRLLPTDQVALCSAPTVLMVAQYVPGTFEGFPCDLSEVPSFSLCLCLTSLTFQKLFLLPGTAPLPLSPLKSIPSKVSLRWRAELPRVRDVWVCPAPLEPQFLEDNLV